MVLEEERLLRSEYSSSEQADVRLERSSMNVPERRLVEGVGEYVPARGLSTTLSSSPVEVILIWEGGRGRLLLRVPAE